VKKLLASAALALIMGVVAGPAREADAALLDVTNVTNRLFDFPTGDKVLGNKLTLGNTATFYEAQISTTANNVKLTFFNMGSNSLLNNVFCAGGTAVCWRDYNSPNTDEKGSITQANSGLVDFKVYEQSPWRVQFDNQTGYKLNDSVGVIFAFLEGNTVVGGPTNRVVFGFNDIGNNFDYDDLTGIIQATPVPAAVWGFGAALAGLAALRRRRKASTAVA
jgi:hypothetical protein